MRASSLDSLGCVLGGRNWPSVTYKRTSLSLSLTRDRINCPPPHRRQDSRFSSGDDDDPRGSGESGGGGGFLGPEASVSSIRCNAVCMRLWLINLYLSNIDHRAPFIPTIGADRVRSVAQQVPERPREQVTEATTDFRQVLSK